MSPSSQAPSPGSPTYPWPVDPNQFDRSAALSPEEKTYLERLVSWAQAGRKGWPKEAKPALLRLLEPLYQVLDQMGTTNAIKRQYTIRATVVCLLVRAMHRHQCSFWAFSPNIWLELLGRDYYAYTAQHGVTANARQQLIGVAYLLCSFEELGQLGHLAYLTLAKKVFGEALMDGVVNELIRDLQNWGYTEKGNIGALHNALSMVFLLQRSPRLADITFDRLLYLYQRSTVKITRRGLKLLSFALARRGQFVQSITESRNENLKERSSHRKALEGIPDGWRYWCQRWYATSSLQPSSRLSTLYRILQVGRWLVQTHPEAKQPGDWTRDTCVAFTAGVNRAKVGQWSCPASSLAKRTGEPFGAKGKEGMLKAVRGFFTDCQEWGWIPRNFNPARDLRTPRSIRALIGPDPRAIADDIWAKMMWAGMNLTLEDLPKLPDGTPHPSNYPLAMIKAVTLVWLFTGLRCNEIRRLRVGCIRWQQPAESRQVCLLDVPVNKTGTAFTKPVDGLVGEAIAAWEAKRPFQPLLSDAKTRERVHFLFCNRGRRLGSSFLNKMLIPLLCKKAGVSQQDARGKITSHRARATIASQLFNAKEPLNLFELQDWLGHHSPESTRHYAKFSPTKMVKSFAKTGYFARNLRAIEVLIDQDAVKSGAAAKGEPWKFYDLGHGYCTYDFFDQCPHRMACAKCSFYRAKGSSQTQLLEGRANLQRMLQEIPLSDDERSAVEEGIQAMEKLCRQLADVPTPSGFTPNQMKKSS